MITLKEALKLSKDELKKFKEELRKDIEARAELNGYVEVLDHGDGVPIAIKDNIQVNGWSVTSGSQILQGYIAPYNATVIDKMSEAGLSAFGRTNMDEFAMGSTTESSFYGKTQNPHNADCVPGGSSGGSAAVVGAGLAIAALGSDTGGSIRQPASFCGIVGMKPTYGRVSRFGLGAYASSLDQIGPMTQNVEDAAILYDIISGHDEKDSTSVDMKDESVTDKLNSDRKLKIAILPKYIEDASNDVKHAYGVAIEALKKAGHTIVEKEMIDAKFDISAYYITATAEATTNLARYDGLRYGSRVEGKNLKDTYFKTRSQFGAEVQRRILLGNFVLSSGYYDAYYVKAQKVRQLIKQNYENIFKEVDLILSPVAPRTAYESGSLEDPLEMYLSDIYTISVNLAGLPAIALPIEKNADNMPVGLQLIAAPFQEQTLFDGALSLEKSL
ncbi:MAG: Asp-tRNA(Asn)/Glu-tRNA(Gln) amidotransferase subunit GatA [Helicobacteraceae bacterium]|nr:Asp-tRNA(Asn)/Glu-tRNA(Gln) amidotransferase subunit GatA [Helicobacteraceae bacterium]